MATRRTPQSYRRHAQAHAFLGPMGRLPLMTAQEEHTRALDIAALRLQLWIALLDHPAMAEPVLKHARARLGNDAVPAWALRTVRACSVHPPDRAKRHDRLARVAGAIVPFDLCGSLSTEVLAELETWAPLGTRQRRAFARYRDAARAIDGRLRAAKHAFARANVGLVVMVAGRYHPRHCAFEDLVQEGFLGLLKAVDRFDPHRGARFSTYAVWWIRDAIQRALANGDRVVRVPVHMVETQARVNRALASFQARHGRRPTLAEVGELVDLDCGRVRRALRFPTQRTVGLDEPLGPGCARTHADLLVSEEADETDPDREALIRRLAIELGRLRPVEAEVIRGRFGLDGNGSRTLARLGKKHGLSGERIRQIQNRALACLREALDAR